MIRAKFRVTSHTQFGPQDTARRIVLNPVYDETIEEDKRFSQATPTGELTMYVNNPAAVDELGLGKSFYVDFTEVPASPPAAPKSA